MERTDFARTEINGRSIWLNPLPTDIKDRLIWAFHNSSAIGANRSARGDEALRELSAELNVPMRHLNGFLRGLLFAERQEAIAQVESVLDSPIFSDVPEETTFQLAPGTRV